MSFPALRPLARGGRRIASGLLIGLALSTAALAQGAGQQPVTLRVGTSNNFGFAPTFAARGDDAVPGFKFNVINFVGQSPAMVVALNAGEIDVAEVGEVVPIGAQSANVPFKIVASTQSWGRGQAIIVNNNSPIRSVKDLKGKKINFVRATNSHWTLYNALKSEGLTLKDIEPVYLPGGTNLQQVLESGNIDAAVAIDTLLTSFERTGSRRVVSAADVGANNVLYYIVSDDALKTKKEAVAAFVRQLARHIAWSHEHPEERAKAVAAILKIDPEVAVIAERNRAAGLRPIDDELVRNNQNIADVFYAEGLIPAPLKVDSTFVRDYNAFIAPPKD